MDISEASTCPAVIGVSDVSLMGHGAFTRPTVCGANQGLTGVIPSHHAGGSATSGVALC